MGLQLKNEKKPEQTSFLILLDADNQEHLEEIQEFLHRHDIEHHKFFEPDEPINSHTAICTEPIYGSMRNKFKKFQLWK
jgi:hypothetical protein